MWESAQAVQAPVKAVCLWNCPIISKNGAKTLLKILGSHSVHSVRGVCVSEPKLTLHINGMYVHILYAVSIFMAAIMRCYTVCGMYRVCTALELCTCIDLHRCTLLFHKRIRAGGIQMFKGNGLFQHSLYTHCK